MDDEDALLRDFCAAEGITDTLSAEDRKLILREDQIAYRNLAKAALDHNASYEDVNISVSHSVPSAVSLPTHQADDTLDVAIGLHLNEGIRANLWVVKTVNEKREALLLLSLLIKNKPMSEITKADARAVSAALQKLPKNRNKSPLTKGLSIDAMLCVEGAPRAELLPEIRTLT